MSDTHDASPAVEFEYVGDVVEDGSPPHLEVDEVANPDRHRDDFDSDDDEDILHKVRHTNAMVMAMVLILILILILMMMVLMRSRLCMR
jgi:predicted nucleic acid-binding Zn ribbon protein